MSYKQAYHALVTGGQLAGTERAELAKYLPTPERVQELIQWLDTRPSPGGKSDDGDSLVEPADDGDSLAELDPLAELDSLLLRDEDEHTG